MGIPAKEVVRLFDPFFQVGQAYSETSRGPVWVWRFVKNYQHDGRRYLGRFRTGNGQPVTVRIPLYGAQYPQKKGVEGLVVNAAGWRSAMRRSVSSWKQFAAQRHRRYNIRRAGTDSRDVLITDEVVSKKWQGRAVVTSVVAILVFRWRKRQGNGYTGGCPA